MATNPNDPINVYLNRHGVEFIGLTKREKFAAMAMMGILANPEAMEIITKGHKTLNEAWELVGKRSCVIADALINELNKQP